MALVLAIGTLALPLTGCTFVNEVQNNDIMGKAAKTIFDDENEVEKLKNGDAEVQKAFEKEKNRRERRERKENTKEMMEENKQEEKAFLFRWK